MIELLSIIVKNDDSSSTCEHRYDYLIIDMKDSIKILVCGDQGAGKTSFVNALVTGSFPSENELGIVMPEVAIPADISDDGVKTLIWDSNDVEMDKLCTLIDEADIALVLFEDNHNAIDRLGLFWLPLIRKRRKEIPIALVRNKIDILSEETLAGIEPQTSALEIMRESFKVPVMLDCSCKTQLGIDQVFRYCHMTVIFPVAPLYDIHTKTLKPMFKRALTRIFRIFDKDMDGAWADDELRDFQTACFENDLSDDQILSLKLLLGEHVQKGKVMFEGMCFMMVMFIERSQLYPVWRILDTFQYDQDLELDLPESLQFFSAPYCAEDSAMTWQLSSGALEFIEDTFHLFAEKGNLMTPEQEREAFKVLDAPQVAPWSSLRELEFNFESDPIHAVPYYPDLKDSTKMGLNGISKDQWRANWQMVTALNPSLVEKYLYWMGFIDVPSAGQGVCHSKEAVVEGSREKFLKRKSKTGDQSHYEVNTDVLQAFVFGRNEDLAVMLRSIALKKQKKYSSADYLNKPTSFPVPVYSDKGIGTDTMKTLILTYIPTEYAEEYSNWSKALPLSRCDVAIITFNPLWEDSVSNAIDLELKLPNCIARVYVSMEKNSSLDGWNTIVKHCEMRGLTPPFPSSSWQNTLSTPPSLQQDNLFTFILARLNHPSLRREIRPRRLSIFSRKFKFGICIVVTAVAAVTIYVIIPYIKTPIQNMLKGQKYAQQTVTIALSHCVASSPAFSNGYYRYQKWSQ